MQDEVDGNIHAIAQDCRWRLMETCTVALPGVSRETRLVSTPASPLSSLAADSRPGREEAGQEKAILEEGGEKREERGGRLASRLEVPVMRETRRESRTLERPDYQSGRVI